MSRFEFDVFLSFASLNESRARILYNQLKRSGLNVFWSDETLKRRVGKSWQKEIEKSLEASKHMVLLWTDEAMQSHWVEDEYRAFYSEIRGKRERLLVPVLGEGMESESLPLFLRQLQSYPMNGNSEALITSLGGHYISLEQENERLRQELEEARKEVQQLKGKKGKGQQAEVNRLSNERDEWKQKYADLENSALEQSTNLSAVIEEKDKEISSFKKRIDTLEKERATKSRKKKPSAKGPPKTITDDQGIEFVLIEPGTFVMGDEEFDWTKPVHNVELTTPFYLGKHPVTQAEWKAIAGDDPSEFKGPQNPIESISWDDIQAFLKKINNGESVYHLPTEAQWEFACRAGTNTPYSFGEDEKQLGHYAWYDENSKESTHPVGEKKPNPWGLYDMHGNVWEWVQDWYGQYENGTVIDPTGPGTGTDRVIRGGSWGSDAGGLRSAYRGFWPPGGADGNVGFRLLRTLP